MIKKVLISIIAIIFLLDFSHVIYFNLITPSMPYGIYMRISGTPGKGDYAATCLTPEIAQYGIERGYLAKGVCKSGTVLVLKKIEGMPGDHFSVKDGYFKVNGVNYFITPKDNKGRSLKAFFTGNDGTVGAGHYLLISNFNKSSWDSRYWGPVGVEFLVKPLWIFDYGK